MPLAKRMTLAEILRKYTASFVEKMGIALKKRFISKIALKATLKLVAKTRNNSLSFLFCA